MRRLLNLTGHSNASSSSSRQENSSSLGDISGFSANMQKVIRSTSKPPTSTTYVNTGFGSIPVHSYGNPARQYITLRSKRSFEQSLAFTNLPDPGKLSLHEGSESTVVVGVGALASVPSKFSAVSNSFAPCVPIASFCNNDAKNELYHAAIHAKDNDDVIAMRKRKPSDMYLVCRPDTHISAPKQRNHAEHIIEKKSSSTNFHIIELPNRGGIAVDANGPNNALTIYYEDLPYHTP